MSASTELATRGRKKKSSSTELPFASKPPQEGERQRVLDAAERTFAECGYADTRMEQIATAARVSLRSVYAVAMGKAKLFRILQELRGRELLSRIEEVLAGEARSPSDLLMEHIALVATFMMDHRDFLLIQLRDRHTWGIDDGRHALSEAGQVGDKVLERLLRRGIRTGCFHQEDPKTMVASLRALEQIQLASWISGRNRSSKRVVTETIQRQAKRLFCRA